MGLGYRRMRYLNTLPDSRPSFFSVRVFSCRFSSTEPAEIPLRFHMFLACVRGYDADHRWGPSVAMPKGRCDTNQHNNAQYFTGVLLVRCHLALGGSAGASLLTNTAYEH